jgi:hypothetical protein
VARGLVTPATGAAMAKARNFKDEYTRRLMSNRFFLQGEAVTNYEEAKKQIDYGIANGTWTILIFHGINEGQDLSISKDDFSTIIDYVELKRSSLMIASVIDIAQWIERKSPAEWTCANK